MTVVRKRKNKITRRDVMRSNNDLAREFLIKEGYTQIWLKNHGKYPEWVWMMGHETEDGKMAVVKYASNDIWGLFDGICIHPNGKIMFLAVSDRFKEIDKITHFIQDKTGFMVMVIKVNKKLKDGPRIDTKVLIC